MERICPASAATNRELGGVEDAGHRAQCWDARANE
jgi:hypothetical protein